MGRGGACDTREAEEKGKGDREMAVTVKASLEKLVRRIWADFRRKRGRPGKEREGGREKRANREPSQRNPTGGNPYFRETLQRAEGGKRSSTKGGRNSRIRKADKLVTNRNGVGGGGER